MAHHPIDITFSNNHYLVLTQDVSDYDQRVSRQPNKSLLKKIGIDRGRFAHFFRENIAVSSFPDIFVVAPKNLPLEADPFDHIAFMVAVDLEHSQQPATALGSLPSEKDLADWKATLMRFSVAFRSILRDLHAIAGLNPRQVRLIFDMQGQYDASLAAIVPASCGPAVSDIHHALTDASMSPAPSAHDQLQALSELEWRWDDEEIPAHVTQGLRRARNIRRQ